jgi:hypothetical protein
MAIIEIHDGRQLAAARALIGLGILELAAAAGVTVRTVHRLETYVASRSPTMERTAPDSRERHARSSTGRVQATLARQHRADERLHARQAGSRCGSIREFFFNEDGT